MSNASNLIESHPAPPLEVSAAGSLVESIGALAALVLSILSLAGVLPVSLLGIATIALGGALLFEGGTLGARHWQIARATHESGERVAELGAGISAEAFAGLTGIVLGILALLRVEPITLIAVATIVFGSGLLLSSDAVARLAFASVPDTDSRSRVALRDGMFAASGAQVLVGIGAIVLGILSLLGNSALVLEEVATLAMSVAVLLSGTAMGARIATRMQKRHG